MSSEHELDMSTTEIRLLVIGKTGNGKSSVCNTIIGQDGVFRTGRSMASTTQTAQEGYVRRGKFHVHVVDTPDTTNLDDMTKPHEMQQEVDKWKELTAPKPSAVLLTIRCDVRYTAEEYAIYKEFLRLWGDDSVKDRLVVVFTFGDRQDRDIDTELQNVCSELKNVLNDASWRYVVFDNSADMYDKEAAVNKVLALAKELEMEARGSLFTRIQQIYPKLIIILILVPCICILVAIFCWARISEPAGYAAIVLSIVGIVYAVAVLVTGFVIYRITCPVRKCFFK